MKKCMIGLGIFCLSIAGYSQQKISFSSIDWTMQSTDAPTPDSLARFINKNFTTELEKVRAVYSWITTHIEYNTAIYKPWSASFKYSPDPLDTAAIWPSGDEMVARKVMRKKMAVCDGYSRLFKVVCTYAGIEAEIIQGYGRVYGTGDKKFRTNHTWNAVRIDSSWHLLDLTWASGHLNFADEFVPQQNNFYFLTSPSLFIKDHYPEELRWTLLSNPPVLSEFRKTPFRSKGFYKYGVDSYVPGNGIIAVSAGDTISFSIQLKDVARAKNTGADPFIDTASYTQWPLSSFIKPVREQGNMIYYSFVTEPGSEWLHLLYNNDVILRYRINVSTMNDANTASYHLPD